MKSKELIATERNIKRLHLDLSDAEFTEMLRRQEVIGKRIEIVMGILAVFVLLVVLVDPVATTVGLGIEYVLKAVGLA